MSTFRQELNNAYKYGESEHPALKAFIAVANEFDIPKDFSEELLNGVEMDLSISSYNDFDSLYLFCYRVASTVGIMMTYVLGFHGGKTTLEYAEKLGIAMQLTNILRDVGEDAKLGRIYIPMDELDRFNVSVKDISNSVYNSQVRELMKFQVSRALKYYMDAQPGIGMLDKESQFTIKAASKIYGELLQKIEQNNYNPFLGRVYVTHNRKIQILLSEITGRFTSK